MNTDTLDRMRSMRLLGMHRAFKTSLETNGNDHLTADEMVAMLIDSEWDDRHNRNIERSLRNARFRYKASIEGVDYNSERGLDKNHLHRLADGEFIQKKENKLITVAPSGAKGATRCATVFIGCCVPCRRQAQLVRRLLLPWRCGGRPSSRANSVMSWQARCAQASSGRP